jgi:hypothetical protein
VDPPLPDDFDLAEHYGDAGLDDPFNDDEEDGDSDEQQEAASHRPKRPTRKPAPELPNSRHETSSMLKALFEFFIPSVNQDPETRRRWRIAMGFAVFCLSCATLVSYGIFSPFGHQGFAYSTDVKSIKVELLEQRIFDARLRQCSATSQESRQFYASKVQELLSKFRETEGQYRLPSCDEVR